MLQSARFAFAGLHHAFLHERNLRLFFVAYSGVLLVAAFLHVTMGEWMALILAGGFFLSIELLNTALERLADIVDDHLKAAHCTHTFEDLKTTKDVAAAASLVSLGVVGVTVALIFIPRIGL